MAHQSEEEKGAHELLRLFECRICSLPFTDAVTLPCGRSICKTCLPQTHARCSITYPALPDRLQGFQCPFDDCGREHASGDCSVDVLLNKVAGHVRDLDLDGEGMAEEPEREEREEPEERDERDDLLQRMQQATRGEMDCQVCYALFHEPLTTGCGHTFCRSCLHRILDHSSYCPICRRRLAINPLLDRASCPSNEAISSIIETLWADELVARQEAHAAEQAANHQQLDVPLFVCTLAFPHMPTFLYVFEPRYRLMIRRALEGDRTFGIVLPKRPQGSGDNDAYFQEIGTLLRIVNVQYYPDGRSLIETVGLSRFKVLRHGSLDGYAVCRTERIDDISLEEEEALEAAEAMPEVDTDTGDLDGQEDAEGADTERMSTQSLMRFATSFVARMRQQSVPWLTQRTFLIYGECPDDPAIFPWWFASILPVKDLDKYRLLGTSSVRDRLKMCCSWIVEWETSRWSLRGCTIL